MDAVLRWPSGPPGLRLPLPPMLPPTRLRSCSSAVSVSKGAAAAPSAAPGLSGVCSAAGRCAVLRTPMPQAGGAAAGGGSATGGVPAEPRRRPSGRQASLECSEPDRAGCSEAEDATMWMLRDSLCVLALRPGGRATADGTAVATPSATDTDAASSSLLPAAWAA